MTTETLNNLIEDRRGRPELSDEIKDLIYEAHNLDMNLKEAADHAKVCTATVRKYWQKNSLETRPRGGMRIRAEAEKLIYEAHKLKMTAKDAAEYAGVAKSTVFLYWDEKGLKSNHKGGKKKLSEKKIKTINDALEDGPGARELAKKLNISITTVYRYWNN